MIDLHAHILPGLDDGIADKEKALRAAQIASNQGINKIVATPHYLPGEGYLPFSKIEKQVAKLQNFLEEKGVNLKLLPGVEAYINPNLVKQVKQGLVKVLNNSQYILVELPMNRIPNYTDDILYSLGVLGYTPVIAHPERYQEVRENPNLLYHWLKKGAVAQLNSGSLLGVFGSEVKETAKILVSHNLVQLIGSDLHGINKRGECLKGGFTYLEKLIGSQAKQYLKNAQLVINNQELNITPPRKYEKKKGLLNKLSFIFDI